MSAYAYIGLQGSGKTLKAVNKLYDNFINPKTKDKSEYDFALTNINEFDFSKSDKINKLDFDVLYEKLVELYNISVVLKKTDTELNEKAKEYNLFNCLIIVDEAPHYLTKEKDTVLLWWIEYHRHMSQDIILITPNKARFRTEYRNSIHYFCKSVSAKYRLRKSVYRYAVFSNYNMNKDDFEHYDSFKVKPELFNLYVSGKAINGTPVIYYYLSAVIIILTLLGFFSLSFLKQFEPEKQQEIKTAPAAVENKKPQTSKQVKSSSSINKIVPIAFNEDERLYKIKCFSDTCFVNLDTYSYEVPYHFIDSLIRYADSNRIKIVETKSYTTFYLITNQNSFNFIIRTQSNNKGVKNEDTKKDSSLFSITK